MYVCMCVCVCVCVNTLSCSFVIWNCWDLVHLANFTIFRYLLTIFGYLSLALGYILQIWLTGFSLAIFAGLANSTTLGHWVLAILASLPTPSFLFLL